MALNVRQLAKYAHDIMSATAKMREAREASTWVTLTPDENKAVLTALATMAGRESKRRFRKQAAEERRARRRT